MTAGRRQPDAEATGGEGWAKTVVDGISEEGPGQTGPSPESDVPPVGSIDDEVVDAELVDDPPDPGGEPVSPDPIDALDDGTPDPDRPDPEPTDPDGVEISVEALVIDLERVSAERDQYLDASRRLQAEFENYKKQITKREADARERANDSLVGELLPVLDAFDGALANGAEDVAPMRSTFLDLLAKQGLERIDPIEDAFDPNLHEAVMHEAGDEADGPVVAEVMRAGYVWKGRVLRPAMVKTRG